MSGTRCAPEIRSSLTRPDYWVECRACDFKSEEFLTLKDVATAYAEHEAESKPARPYCLRCEVPIYRDERDVWRREATGVAECPRNPAQDGHEALS